MSINKGTLKKISPISNDEQLRSLYHACLHSLNSGEISLQHRPVSSQSHGVGYCCPYDVHKILHNKLTQHFKPFVHGLHIGMHGHRNPLNNGNMPPF